MKCSFILDNWIKIQGKSPISCERFNSFSTELNHPRGLHHTGIYLDLMQFCQVRSSALINRIQLINSWLISRVVNTSLSATTINPLFYYIYLNFIRSGNNWSTWQRGSYLRVPLSIERQLRECSAIYQATGNAAITSPFHCSADPHFIEKKRLLWRIIIVTIFIV